LAGYPIHTADGSFSLQLKNAGKPRRKRGVSLWRKSKHENSVTRPPRRRLPATAGRSRLSQQAGVSEPVKSAPSFGKTALFPILPAVRAVPQNRIDYGLFAMAVSNPK
jgi:hypothetical protein